MAVTMRILKEAESQQQANALNWWLDQLYPLEGPTLVNCPGAGQVRRTLAKTARAVLAPPFQHHCRGGICHCHDTSVF